MRNDHSTRKTLGIVGLGIMGGAMAEAFLAAGYVVYGYDPATAAAQRLKRAGGTALTSVTEVAERADVLITALASHSALAEAVEGICRSRKRRRLLIEMSTLPLADKRRARARLARARVIALDCPVSGTAVRLKERTWTIFASGAKAACARVQPVLAVLADNVPYVGTYGDEDRSLAEGHAHHRRDGARRRRADAPVRRLCADLHRRVAAGLWRGRHRGRLRSARPQIDQVLSSGLPAAKPGKYAIYCSKKLPFVNRPPR